MSRAGKVKDAKNMKDFATALLNECVQTDKSPEDAQKKQEDLTKIFKSFVSMIDNF